MMSMAWERVDDEHAGRVRREIGSGDVGLLDARPFRRSGFPHAASALGEHGWAHRRPRLTGR